MKPNEVENLRDTTYSVLVVLIPSKNFIIIHFKQLVMDYTTIKLIMFFLLLLMFIMYLAGILYLHILRISIQLNV